MAPRRRATMWAATTTGALLVGALALAAAPMPAEAQTASSWLQVFNMLLKPRACANGKVLAVCRRDPCAVTSCPSGFRCKADYCGACAGLCEAEDVGAGADAADAKAEQAAAPTCEVTGAPGKTAVRPTCSTPMCTYMQCGTGMACVNDFCGGCTGTCVNATETISAGGALKGGIQGSSLASVTACRAGEYMASAGCRQCIPGSVSKAGATECTMCQMGTFANESTNTCDKCPPGTASAALRATSCMPCNGGKYSDKEGSVMCSACAEGMTTPRDKAPHTTCTVAPPEAPLPTKPSGNATADGKDGSGGPDSFDDAKFDELFMDEEEKADAAFGGDKASKGGKGKAKGSEDQARADAVTSAALKAGRSADKAAEAALMAKAAAAAPKARRFLL